MTRTTTGARRLAPLGAPALLAGCNPSAPNYQTVCVFETSVPGAYTSRIKDGRVSEAVPVYEQGGTDAGAAKLNACIRRKAAADGARLIAPASGARISSVQTGPNTFTETFELGAARSAPAPTRMAALQPAAAPSGTDAGTAPLSPEDAALLATLSGPARDRALLFVRNGMTVRDSLLAD